MNHLTYHAHAKINLYLQVIGKRADGYHDLRMVMQSLALHDTLTFCPTFRKGHIAFTILNRPDLPTDDGNLVVRAARRLFDMFPPDGGAAITLDKQIPVAAGLAGGSADCAATLRGIRDMFAMPIDNDGLAVIGKSLGADVPYCLRGGSCLAEGIGERLTPLPPMPPCIVLLAKPPVNISTADVFRAYNADFAAEESTANKNRVNSLSKALEAQDVSDIARALSNDLEGVTEATTPIITNIKQIMTENGAEGSLMSGSGPSVFGLYKNESTAKRAMCALQAAFPDMPEIFLTAIHA